MRRPHVRFVAVMACVTIIAACGGDAEAPETTDTAAPDTTVATSGSSREPTGAETDGEPEGTFAGTITLDDTTTRFSFDRVDWSAVETPIAPSGSCNPDFFGGGRWFAIGFAVDDNDAIVTYNDGLDFASVTFDLPPDTWADEQRDPPELDLDLGDDEYRIATPEEAGSGPMAWTISDTTLVGSATVVDSNGDTHTLEFDIECSGERSSTFDLDDLPDDAGEETPVDAADLGSGTFNDGETTHTSATVARCLPGDDSDPRNFEVSAFSDGSFIIITVTHHTPFVVPGSEAEPEVETHVNLFVSRDSLGIQFEGRIMSTDGETWYTELPLHNPAATPLENTSFTVTDTRVSGEVHDLEQSWPDAGAELASITFDVELPAEPVDC